MESMESSLAKNCPQTIIVFHVKKHSGAINQWWVKNRLSPKNLLLTKHYLRTKNNLRAKNKLMRWSVLFFLSLIISPITQASEWGVAVGYGFASGLTAYRISAQLSTFYCCELGSVWPMNGFLELSYNQINNKNDSNANTPVVTTSNNNRNNNSSIYGASLNHTFRVAKSDFAWCLAPYVEAAPGIAFFSEGNVRGGSLNNAALFELKLGAGFRFGRQRQYDLGYKYIRFSKFSHIVSHSTSALGLNYLVLNLWF